MKIWSVFLVLNFLVSCSSAPPKSSSLQTLLELEKGDNSLLGIMNLCYQKKFAEAFSQLRTLSPTPSLIYWNTLGSCSLLEGNQKKALLYYNQALEKDPLYAPVLNNIGVLYRSQQEDQKALLAFQRAYASSPLSFTPQLNMANLYLEYGLPSKADDLLRPLLQTHSSQAQVLAALGLSALLKNRPQEAIEYFERLDQKSRELPNIGLNYAFALILEGDRLKAKAVLNLVNLKEEDHPLKNYNQYLRERVEREEE